MRIALTLLLAAALNAAPALASEVMLPAPGSADVHSDTLLEIRFDAPPRLGEGGHIRVFTAAGVLVDDLDLGTTAVDAGGETQRLLDRRNMEIDKLGAGVPGLTRWRFTWYRPVSIVGDRAVIKLRDGALRFGGTYYVTIDPGTIEGATEGKPFTGISAGQWRFRTRAAPRDATRLTVDDDGEADFRTLQGALDHVMATGCRTCAAGAQDKRIALRPGRYDGQLYLTGVDRLTIAGEGRARTEVSADNYDLMNPGIGEGRAAPDTRYSPVGKDGVLGTRLRLGGGRSLFLIEDADQIRLTGFTLRNRHIKAPVLGGQAETLHFNSTSPRGSRLIATDMSFESAQDTLLLKGWVWIHRSLIAGDVDFIWGTPYAVLIEDSEIRTLADTVTPGSGGYIFQARAVAGYPGFVVLNSRLTAGPGVPDRSTFLARSGGFKPRDGHCLERPEGAPQGNRTVNCDNIAYIGTRMGPHIAPVGWLEQPMPGVLPSAMAGWREWRSTGPTGRPLDLSRRSPVGGTRIDLSGLDTRAEIFAGWNGGAGWDPHP
ncbi:pectin methylesterase-like acyl-CoA thioesterase [Sphingomonas zeicaulis]|uniref:hypothetical protein n=1 Tax=Sphingomonas zeicaulis TaxID=1632740 RepID=UPI003D1EDF3C